MQEEAADDPVAAFRHLGVAGGGDLVQAVGAVGHPGPFGPEIGEGPGQQVGMVGPRYADELPGDPGRVGQRTEQIEDGAHAEVAPGAGRVTHRGMECGREQKRDAAGVEAAFDDRRGRIHGNPEGAEEIGASAAARDRAVAVLRDRHAAPGEDEGGQRRDVECRGAIAPGAAGIEPRPVAGRQRDRVRAHRRCQPDDLGRPLPLHRQRDQQSRDLGRGGASRHDLLHGVRRLADGQVPAEVEPLYQLGKHQHSRKFRRIWWPTPVNTDSGWNCTPWTGHSRCRTAMIVPSSAARATTSSSEGQVPGATASE